MVKNQWQLPMIDVVIYDHTLTLASRSTKKCHFDHVGLCRLGPCFLVEQPGLRT